MSMIACNSNCRHQAEGCCCLETVSAPAAKNGTQPGNQDGCLFYEERQPDNRKNNPPVL